MKYHICMRLAVNIIALFLVVYTFSSAARAQQVIKECQDIDESGSYVLGNNLPNNDSLNGRCISIRADFVTLDLGGYTIRGNNKGDGVTDRGNRRRSIVIRNGNVTNFRTGINLSNTNDAVVERVQAVRNTRDGIVARRGCRLKDNIANRNDLKGIVVTDGKCLVANNLTSFNGDSGMRIAGGGNTVSGNTADNNEGQGLEVGCPSNVIGNTIENNVIGGIGFLSGGCNDFDNLIDP